MGDTQKPFRWWTSRVTQPCPNPSPLEYHYDSVSFDVSVECKERMKVLPEGKAQLYIKYCHYLRQQPYGQHYQNIP